MSADTAHAGADEVGRSCPYCRFSFKGGVAVVSCPSCKAVHHSECWEENGGCAVLGCESAPSATVPQPAAPAPPPPGGRASAPQPPPPTQPRPPSPLANAPSAAEVAVRVKTWLATPVATAAGIAGATAVAIMLVSALAIAIVTPDTSAISPAANGLFKETLRIAASMTLAPFGASGFHLKLLPMLFVAVPIAATAFAASRESRRTADLPAGARLIAGAAAAIPLAVLLVIVGALSSEEGFGPAVGPLFVLSLLWGAAGGLIGVARAIGPGSMSAITARLSPAAARWAGLAWIALRPLAVVLVLTSLVGIAAWTVQVVRGEQTAKAGRSTVHAIIETPFFAGEYAVGITALGLMAKARSAGEEGGIGGARSTPVPLEEHGEFSHFGETWRIFAFSDNWAPFTFVLLLILAIGLPVALACYAGYVVARAAGITAPGPGAAHGALVGVVWAVALMLMRWIGNVQFLAGDSVFTFALLTAGVAGALGGLLAARGAPSTAATAPVAAAETPAAEEPAAT